MTPEQVKNALRNTIRAIGITALVILSPALTVAGLVIGAFGGFIGTVAFLMCLFAWAFSHPDREKHNWEELCSVSWSPLILVGCSSILLILYQFVPK